MKKLFLIFNPRFDDYDDIKGYFEGTMEEVKRFVKECNVGVKDYQKAMFKELIKLN